ncbi:MAG TPA: GNAT family N-acetyltransferase [Yinghuangia sp.]|uniref:GNAT family N-acetyltransferase n=1 Tax=Yinghuangia sp. YIM S10712 TaxID=3436930 RepID=UPI002CECD201|nr:GNAT family N-acetyltransferase [Yinghuangia sp.]
MIRTAVRDDVPTILRFIHELAAYERAVHEVKATEEDLARDLFGPAPAAQVLIADDDAGRAVGFALWFTTYSTWLGRPGLYLEDLYVTPEARGAGHGRALLAELARIAVERGHGRVEWSVLDWNEPAIGFYKALGATPQDEWTVYRLTGEALAALGAR